MYIFITVLIILVCIVLVLAVLIQNPKGGGLGAGFGGIGNQVMGARKATDFIERATWILAICLFVFSLTSTVFMPKSQGDAERPQNEFDRQLMESGQSVEE